MSCGLPLARGLVNKTRHCFSNFKGGRRRLVTLAVRCSVAVCWQHRVGRYEIASVDLSPFVRAGRTGDVGRRRSASLSCWCRRERYHAEKGRIARRDDQQNRTGTGSPRSTTRPWRSRRSIPIRISTLSHGMSALVRHRICSIGYFVDRSSSGPLETTGRTRLRGPWVGPKVARRNL